MGGNKVSPNPALVESYPDVYLTTGLVAENHVRDYGISREEQDAFALRSHERALAAIDAGRFTDEIVPLAYRVAVGRATDRAHRPSATSTFAQDEGPRRDTSLEALAQAEAGVSRDRQRHRRQLVADERRRRGGAGDVGGVREGARAARRWRVSSPTRRPASSRNGSASARCPRSARR